ncbi:MAG: GatB/YqeY domain-containing protein [Blautia sp.]|nr:GatB/YqeY domain-containing protein [Blautia sp.]
MELEALRKDMVAAMKAKDKVKKDAVSSLIAAVKKVAIDEGCRDDIKEELVNRVILKELKTVKEQIDTCPDSRQDLKEEYQARYDIIAGYAPQQMDAQEVKAFLEEKFADVLGTKNKGQIMKTVMPVLKGKADGKVINQVVAEICQ